MSPYGDMFSSTNKFKPSLTESKDSSTDSPMGKENETGKAGRALWSRESRESQSPEELRELREPGEPNSNDAF